MKKLEVPTEAAVPCLLRTKKRPFKLREIDSEPKGFNKFQKKKHASVVEAHESSRQRLEATLPKDHEGHIAVKGFNSPSHKSLVRQFVSLLQAMNIPYAKAAADKTWEKLEKLPAWQLTKQKSKIFFWKHKKSCGTPKVFQEFGMCTERVCLLSLCCFSFIVMMMSLHLGSGPLSLTCCVCLLAMMK